MASLLVVDLAAEARARLPPEPRASGQPLLPPGAGCVIPGLVKATSESEHQRCCHERRTLELAHPTRKMQLATEDSARSARCKFEPASDSSAAPASTEGRLSPWFESPQFRHPGAWRQPVANIVPPWVMAPARNGRAGTPPGLGTPLPSAAMTFATSRMPARCT